MKTITRKTLSLLMAVCMLFCAMPVFILQPQAAGNGVQQKLEQIKKVYPDQCAYFTANGQACTYWYSDCTNCNVKYVPARGGLPSGAASGFDGTSCWAFASYVGWVVFGTHFYSWSITSSPSVGDVIHTWGYDAGGNRVEHYSIFLSQDSNYWYVYDGNGTGDCSVRYNGKLSKTYNYLCEYYHASNYDAINNTVSTYTLDVNVYQDGIMHDTGVDCCTFDVTINGSRVANDVKDYYTKDSHPEGYASGSTYKIDDIKINGCYKNNAKTSYTGTITADTEVNLEVVTYHPSKTVSGKAATCTETGLTSGTVCSKCGKVLTAQTTIPAKGHSYTSEIIPGSCTEPAKIKYTCSGCGDTYTTVPGEEWSDWSTSVPPAGAEIESKTQWSASRKDMKTSSQSSMSGYELDSSATQYGVWQNAGWTSTKPTENDVKRITETRKVVDSNAYTEYKYYHYYGYDGNTLYNSYGNYYWKNYESTVSTTAFPLDKAYDGYQGYAKNVGLHGSLWFLESTTNVPEKSHTEWFYQTRTATYTFYKWSDYGAWQDTEIKADDNTRVQTRIVYRYRLKAADVAGHTWNSGVVTTPATCTSAGVKTFTCTVCTATKTEAISKLDHTYTNKADAKYLKSAATETSAAVYYKSCSMCGVKGTETFTYGDPVPPAVETDTVLGVSSAKTMAGKEITLTLALEKNPGIAGLSVSLNYDEAALTLKTASNGTMFSSLTSGKNFIFDNASNVTSDGTVATFTFTVNANADAGDYFITPVVRSCVNDEGEDVPVKVEKGTVTVIDFIYGDANDDEVIDMKDVVLLRRYLAEFDYETNSSPVEIGFGADANGDGTIDMKDVVLLRKYLANYDYETNTSTEVLGPQ